MVVRRMMARPSVRRQWWRTIGWHLIGHNRDRRRPLDGTA
jgi:hypothetical protein